MKHEKAFDTWLKKDKEWYENYGKTYKKDLLSYAWQACEQHYEQMKCESCKYVSIFQIVTPFGGTCSEFYCNKLEMEFERDFNCRYHEEKKI